MQVALLEQVKCKNANENKCAHSTQLFEANLHSHTYLHTVGSDNLFLPRLFLIHLWILAALCESNSPSCVNL